MRVLETTPPTYSMVKKKHRLRKQDDFNADNSSDEVTMGGTGTAVRGCGHIVKAVNFQSMKKSIKQNLHPLGDCSSCCRDGNKKNEKENEKNSASGGDEDLLENMETTIWLCLQCGHQGCDRNSKEKHALKHFTTPRSVSHAIVLNLTTWVIWCYECDDEVQCESSKKLKECVDFVRKQTGMGRTDSPVTVGKSNCLARQGSFTGADNNTVVATQDAKPKLPIPVSVQSLPKVRGLSNLGNTCFFNAVLQNLSQTPELDVLLAEHCKKGMMIELPGNPEESDSDSGSSSEEADDASSVTSGHHLDTLKVTLFEGGNLTQSLLTFLRDMHSTAMNNIISPSALFGQVCMKTPRFKSYQQQDSHELLRHLLDGMRTEEIKRAQAAILKAFGLPENVNPRKVDEDTKAKVKAYGSLVKHHTFIDGIFGGYLISTVSCQECDKLSQIFEPFLDLSLPINEEKPGRPNVHMSSNTKKEKQTEKEPTTPEPLKKGSDGFAFDASKKSKHQAKKERKMSSRQRKAKKRKQLSKAGKQEKEDESDSPGQEEEGSLPTGEGAGQADGDPVSEKSENWGSNDENTSNSDADVEDNLESDASRRRSLAQTNNMYAPLMDNEEGQLAEAEGGEKGCVDRVKLKYEETGKSGHTDSDTDSSSSDSSSEDEVIEYMKFEDEQEGGTDDAAEQVTKDLENLALEEQAKADRLSHGNGVIEDCDAVVENPHSKDSNKELICNGIKDNSDDAVDIGMKGGCQGECKCADQSECRKSDTVACDGSNCNNSALKLEPSLCNDTADSRKEIIKVNGDSLHVPSVDEDASSNVSDNTLCNNVDGEEKIGDELLGAVGGNVDEVSVSEQSTPKHAPVKTKSKKELRKENVRKAMSSLSSRYLPLAHECSVLSCLNQFTAAELLTGNNKFGCESCSKKKHKEKGNKGKMEMVYTNACKQLLIFRPPAILTLHLKRFQQVGYSLRKVNRFVDFPLILDLAPFCSSLAEGVRPNAGVKYSLYGVVEHSGRLTGGHYTAYVKVRPNNSKFRQFVQKKLLKIKWDANFEELLREMPEEEPTGVLQQGKWYYISDTHVKETSEAQVLKSQAYILFYERII